MAKILIMLGIVLIVFGLILYFSKDIPILGKLPGDIHIRKERFSFYFPFTTSLLISIFISLILYLIQKFR